MAWLTRARHKLRRPRSRTLLIAVAVAAVFFLLGSVIRAQFGEQAAQDQTAVVEDQRDGAAAQALSLAEQIQQACSTGDLAGAVCQKAVEVAADPVPVDPPDPIEGPRGPGPTPEQIRLAVEAYLAANPPPGGRAPTPGEIAAAVQSYLQANPPSPGRAPTAAEIADAVAVYYANNPPPPGRDGQPGRAPTPDEIRAAVAAELAANPPPAGKPGDAGPQGVSVQSVASEVRDGACFLVFTLVDPSTSTTSEQAVPVPDGVCDELPGP